MKARRECKTTLTPQTECPYCSKKLNAVTDNGVPGRGPQPGDVTICWDCTEPLVLTDDLQVRKLTDAEARMFATHPEVQRIRQLIQQFKAWRKGQDN